MIEKLIKPLIDDAYKRGYSAGVSAEKLVKIKDREHREWDLLQRGIELGRKEIIDAMGPPIEEISAKEFEEITGMNEKPFGFVGTIDDIGLILDEAN